MYHWQWGLQATGDEGDTWGYMPPGGYGLWSANPGGIKSDTKIYERSEGPTYPRNQKSQI